MSDTPRTDAARGFHDMDTAVSAEDMAQLETELADAKLDAEDQAKWALRYLARAEKAEADTARLDWLQSSISLHVNSIALRGDIRDAIDAAMKEGIK